MMKNSDKTDLFYFRVKRKCLNASKEYEYSKFISYLEFRSRVYQISESLLTQAREDSYINARW